jgi:outer membrane protein assembly factor BamB
MVSGSLLVLLSLTFVELAPATGDWPAWRGADRTGLSTETGLLRAWPEAGPELLWTARGLGDGFSTPAVAGNLILVMGNHDAQEWVMALDRAHEGKLVWETPTGAVRHGGGGYAGPRSTPTVDGALTYALGLNGDLVCLTTKTGELVWKKELASEEFGGQMGGWGYCESVLVDGPWVVCTPGGNKATMLALDKKSGEPIWRSDFGDGAHYSSIVVAELAGRKQYVQLLQSAVVGVDAADGKLLWKYGRCCNGTANCSTPVIRGDAVFAASGYGTGGALLQIESQGGEFAAREVYFSTNMRNHHGGMVVVDGYLYGSDEGILTCLNLETGEVAWRDRGPGKCSVAYAEGQLFLRSEGGVVTLAAASSEQFEMRGQFQETETSGAPTWPHPVLAHGCLYLRDQDKLCCFRVK